MRRRVIVLGSTGSIGRQTLAVIARYPERFEVVGLAAGSDRAALMEQAAVFDHPPCALGIDEAVQVTRDIEADVVVNAIAGSAGLGPTIAALDAGRTLALANKESLVIGGGLVTARAAPGQIVPIDSEHSAIAQALRSGARGEVRRLILTASGGPFLRRDHLDTVTLDEALQHPNFAMGPEISINSATLVNKGLEVIEAHVLFGVPYEQIDVVIHPEQRVHSMVEFCDGATVAQVGVPRMLVPIALALSWPDRLTGVDEPVHFVAAETWQFEPVDEGRFPAVRLARQVGQRRGSAPAVYNAANERAVRAFRGGRLPFAEITDVISEVLDQTPTFDANTIDELREATANAHRTADEVIAGRVIAGR